MGALRVACYFFSFIVPIIDSFFWHGDGIDSQLLFISHFFQEEEDIFFFLTHKCFHVIIADSCFNVFTVTLILHV